MIVSADCNVPRLYRTLENGKREVAVLISGGYGAGWSTWNSEFAETLLFHRELIALVEVLGTGPDSVGRIVEVARELCDFEIYGGGAKGLYVKWVPEGELFRVHEYDGSESLIIFDENNYIRA